MSLSSQAAFPSLAFAGRQKVAEVTYGDTAPHLQALDCSGGRCPPDRLLPLCNSRAWFGYQGLMPIGLIDLEKGSVLKYLDFSRRELPSGERLATQLYGAFSHSAQGKVHILMPSASPKGGLGQQFLLECSQEGEVLEMRPLPVLSHTQLLDFAQDAQGRLWIADEGGTKVLSPKGELLFKIAGSGILLHNGMLLTQGKKPRLLDADGQELGPVSGKSLPRSVFWGQAGPHNLVTREEVSASESLSLLVHEVHVLDAEARTLSLVDYLVFPAPPKPDADEGDSGMTPRGFTTFAFDAEGGILAFEDAGSGRFYRQKLLRGEEAWRQRLQSLPDGELSRAELEWYRAEYLARVGRLEPSSPFYKLLQRAAWFEAAAKQERGKPPEQEDPLWRRLEKLQPR